MKSTFTNKIGIKKFKNQVEKQFFSRTFKDQYINDTFSGTFKAAMNPEHYYIFLTILFQVKSSFVMIETLFGWMTKSKQWLRNKLAISKSNKVWQSWLGYLKLISQIIYDIRIYPMLLHLLNQNIMKAFWRSFLILK